MSFAIFQGTEEAFLLVKGNQLGVIYKRRSANIVLEIVHGPDGIALQLVPIDNNNVRIKSCSPLGQMFSIITRGQTTLKLILERIRPRRKLRFEDQVVPNHRLLWQ